VKSWHPREEGNKMKENSLVQLFVRNLVMAIPWGIIFLVVFLIVSLGIKQQVKEALQYTVRTSIYESARFALDYPVFTRAKQNVKEGVEFTAKTARNELRNLLTDPQVKEDLKEIFQYRPKGYTE
jgi:hypothetical protein